MIVVFTASAAAELEAIGDYIALDDPDRALRFVAELREACERLAEFPARFPLVEGYRDVGIRRRSLGNYAIFYRVTGDVVVVLHVVHGARDVSAVLGR